MAENTNNTKKSVQTTAVTITNGKALVPSALKMTYWDDRVKFEFAPELPEGQQTEQRRYDYEHQVTTTLSRAKCNEIANLYEDIILPALKSNEQKAISVPIAGVNQLGISTNIVNGEAHPILFFAKDISPDTLIASDNNIISYEFNRGEYITDYDAKTGHFSDRVITHNELDLFIKDLKATVNAMSNAYVHTDRVVNKFWKDTIDSKLNRIGEKNGLDLAYKPRYGVGGNGGQGSIFDKPSSDVPTSNQSTINNINDLESAMGL